MVFGLKTENYTHSIHLALIKFSTHQTDNNTKCEPTERATRKKIQYILYSLFSILYVWPNHRNETNPETTKTKKKRTEQTKSYINHQKAKHLCGYIVFMTCMLCCFVFFFVWPISYFFAYFISFRFLFLLILVGLVAGVSFIFLWFDFTLYVLM